MNQLISHNKTAILELAKQHGVKSISLFGSMVRGDVSTVGWVER